MDYGFCREGVVRTSAVRGGELMAGSTGGLKSIFSA